MAELRLGKWRRLGMAQRRLAQRGLGQRGLGQRRVAQLA